MHIASSVSFEHMVVARVDDLHFHGLSWLQAPPLDGRVHGRVHQLFALVKMILIVVALFATKVPLAVVIVNAFCCLSLAAYHTSVRKKTFLAIVAPFAFVRFE